MNDRDLNPTDSPSPTPPDVSDTSASSLQSDDADTAILPLQPPPAPIPEPVAALGDDDTLVEPLSVKAAAWTEFPAPLDADADIDAALAAVASLGSVGALDAPSRPMLAPTDDAFDDYAAAPDHALEERLDDLQAASPPRAARPPVQPTIALPPMARLKRGSLASLVPALILIGAGAWLTLITTSGAALDTALVALIGIGGGVLSLLAYWVSTRRWSRGALFTAVTCALIGGLVALTVAAPALNLTLDLSLVQAYPLLVACVGIAMLSAAVLARPRPVRAAFAPGVVVLAAGIIGFLVTSGVIPQNVVEAAAPLWFVPVVALVVLWLLPIVFRLRERR